MRIVDLLDELHVPYRQHGESSKVTEGWVGVECPFCSHGPFYLGINIHTGFATCWACGPHSLAAAVAAVAGIETKEASLLTRDLERVPFIRRERGRLVLPQGIGELLPAHRHYLEGRGFDPDELVATWKIQGIGFASTHAWRLFIPIHHDKEVVSWTTRAIGSVPLADRYRSARATQEAVPKREILYGADKARHGVVVHEGPIDVWATGPGAVCTCGTGFSEVQIARLARFPVRAVCFDSEPAARRRANALADALALFPGETHVVTLSGHDAATSPPSERRELRQRFLV